MKQSITEKIPVSSIHDEEYIFEQELIIRDFDEEEKQQFFTYDELVGPRRNFGIKSASSEQERNVLKSHH